MTETIEELDALVARDAELTEQLEHVDAERKTIRARLGELLDLGTHTIAGCKVSVTEPLRWTAQGKAKFAADYPVAHFPDLYTAVIDPKGVELYVAPADAAKYKTRGARQVSVR